MSIPLLSLLGFIIWTLVMLIILSICRWMHITKGHVSLQAVQPDQNYNHPSDLHRRVTRAHLNCLENLPIYTGLIFIVYTLGLKGVLLDSLAVIFILSRIIQSLIHLSVPQTNKIIPFRSLFYGVQFVIYIFILVMIINQSLLA